MDNGKGIHLSLDRSWTSTGDLLLLQLLEEEYNINGICRFLNRSRDSVEERIRFLMVNHEYLTQIRRSLGKENSSERAWAVQHGVHSGRLKIR